MKKTYTVDSTCNNMRIDRWFRHKLGKIPQGLIEKYLRSGKIKLNKKKIKSSNKVKTNDIINFFQLIPEVYFQDYFLSTYLYAYRYTFYQR